MKPKIGITMGDPAGVGPEILLKALTRLPTKERQQLVIYGDRAFLFNLSKKLHSKINLNQIEFLEGAAPLGSVRFGVATSATGHASGVYIESAVTDALEKKIQAIVTLPINKLSFKMGGWGKKYVGHTEMLATLTHTKKFALMLMHDNLRAVHVTQHIPLKEVSRHITIRRVIETIELTHEGLRKMGILKPKIAVCGLNPHAGDSGVLGKEDQQIIAPAVRQCKRREIAVEGPLSADAVWPLVISKKFDAGVAMYHDQGQIAVKLAAFQSDGFSTVVRGVNVTLGLPIIRTSVAHGTAYDIAGKGLASPESFLDALRVAQKMV